MTEVVVLALEVLAILLIAAGVVYALLPLIGLASLAAGGVVILGATIAAGHLGGRK